MTETGSFQTFGLDNPQGWVFAVDIAAVAAAVLREGPEKHGGANYWLSTELLTGREVASILSESAGREITCIPTDPVAMDAAFAQIPSVPVRAYMASASITRDLSVANRMVAQAVVRDEVQTVLGCPGITMAEWARDYFAARR